MAKFISHGSRGVSVHYSLSFRYVDDPGAGFGFACDEDGNVLPTITPQARVTLTKCTAGIGQEFTEPQIIRYENSYMTPAVIECSCGAHVTLGCNPATCDRCGADYNMSGQRLAPRSQWGEETDEYGTFGGNQADCEELRLMRGTRR